MSSYEPTPPPLPLHEGGPSALIVRPDVLKVSFLARVEEAEVTRAVAALEAAVEALARGLSGALPGAAVQMRGLEQGHAGKLKGRAEGVTQASGLVEVPLPTEASFWPRARAMAAVLDISRAAVAQGQRMRPAVDASFGVPTALVREPEQRRTALIERWLARARPLAALAQASGLAGGLHMRECAAPGPVTQHPISLEEVELRLEIHGPLLVHAATPDP